MTIETKAIYEGGVLRPLAPLDLQDNAVVSVSISIAATSGAIAESQDQWERNLLGIARNCGVSLPDSALISESLYE
jgi:predicted DNA-binding antitoxin AbrB/MazE fold protein